MVRRVADAWSGGNRIIVTDCLNPRTSRALVFSVNENILPAVIDKGSLQTSLPPGQTEHLAANDHVFIEAHSIDEEGTRLFQVWGYGNGM